MLLAGDTPDFDDSVLRAGIDDVIFRLDDVDVVIVSVTDLQAFDLCEGLRLLRIVDFWQFPGSEELILGD